MHIKICEDQRKHPTESRHIFISYLPLSYVLIANIAIPPLQKHSFNGIAAGNGIYERSTFQLNNAIV